MENVPWFVGGGASHSPEVARLLAYAGTGGNGGIVEPGGLKVQPLATPGTSVRVMTGAAVLVNQYPGGGQQSYLVRNPVQEQVAITATGSGSSRSDLVIVRVLDPQYEGSAPADPDAFSYARTAVIQGVAASVIASVAAAQAYCQTLPYPCEPLAGITLPASTATVTSAMIRDLRQIASKRSASEVLMTSTGSGSALTSSTEVKWLDGLPVTVPAWATHMSVVLTMTGVGVRAKAATGVLRLRAGASGEWYSGAAAYDVETLENASGVDERTTLAVGGKMAVSSAMKGTTVTIQVDGARTATNPAGAGLVTKAGMQLLYLVTFTQETV